MLENIDDVNAMFDTMFNLFNPKKGSLPAFPYALKKKNSDGTLIMEIAVTGITSADLTITAKDNVLTISTKDKETTTSTEYTVYYDHIKRPAFSLPFRFPCEYDVSSAVAKVENGLCIINIPRKSGVDTETEIAIS